MEREKKGKTNHQASWVMPFRLRMLYISIVLSSLFFFNERSVFLFLGACVLWYDCNMEVGTAV